MNDIKMMMVLVLCVSVVMGDMTSSPLESLSEGDEEEILDWHNLQRSSVEPPATNMLRLVRIIITIIMKTHTHMPTPYSNVC